MTEPLLPDVARVGRSERRLLPIVAAFALGVLVAVWKPWAASPEASTSPSPSPSPVGGSARASTPPTPSATATPLEARYCINPEAWRVLTNEQSGGRHTSTILNVAPAGAAGAADPLVPSGRLYAEHMTGLGYCIPATEPAMGGPATVRVWRIPRVGAVPLGPIESATMIPVTPEPGQRSETFHVPPPWAVTGEWPPGRYVLEVRYADRASRSLWMALDFISTIGMAPDRSAPPATRRP